MDVAQWGGKRLQMVISIKELLLHGWLTSSTVSYFSWSSCIWPWPPILEVSPRSHLGPVRLSSLSAEKSEMAAAMPFLYMSSASEGSQATIWLSYSRLWALFFSWPLISSVQSQCLLLLCSQHGQRWKILSLFSLYNKSQSCFIPFLDCLCFKTHCF